MSASTLNFLDPNGTDVVPIAPELMGDQGLPPRSNNTADSSSIPHPGATDGDASNSAHGGASGAPVPDYPGFASSNARGGDAPQAWPDQDQYAPPWDEAEYHTFPQHPPTDPDTLAHPPADVEAMDDVSKDHEHAEGDEGGDGEGDGERKKKRPRVTKPRKSKIDKEDPLDGVDVEWEDPSQDPKTGPVFIHPPPGTAQACVRCHRIKRKCDQARPRCQGCGKADVPCVFELSPATSTYVNKLKSERNSAYERIALLETTLGALERGEPINTDPSAGLDSSLIGGSTFEDRAHFEKQFQQTDLVHDDFTNLARTILSVRGDNFDAVPSSTGSAGAELPPMGEAINLLERYADRYSVVLPWLDVEEAKRDLNEVYVGGSNGKDVQFWLGLALGADTQHKKRYKDKAMASFGAAVAKEDLNAVQSLILLATYQLTTPAETSPWRTIQGATQIALDLDLHRQSEAHVSATEAEKRSKVFWSLYNLEQAIASALGKSSSIPAADLDLSIPHTLTTPSRHVVEYHRLSADIGAALNSASFATSEERRESRLAELRVSLDAAKATATPDHVGMWLLAQYHRLSAFSYLPSPLDPSVTASKLKDAHAALVQYVDLAQTSGRPALGNDAVANAFTAYTLVALLYVLSEYDQRASGISSTAGWKNEVKKRLAQVNELRASLDNAGGAGGKVQSALDALYARLEGKYAAGDASNEGMDVLVDAIGGEVDLSRVMFEPKAEEVGATDVEGIWQGLWRGKTLWGVLETKEEAGVWLL